MPQMTQRFNSPERKVHRYKIKATGEFGSGVSENGARVVGRQVTIGPEMNIRLIDILQDETGEVRTFREDFLEEITE